ncbi:MAG: hypothetical protein JO166_17135 [Deltaproteobacteria bacterium]|nr:hypothetical protein [Deltaproteobacteria bacterium]
MRADAACLVRLLDDLVRVSASVLSVLQLPHHLVKIGLLSTIRGSSRSSSIVSLGKGVAVINVTPSAERNRCHVPCEMASTGNFRLGEQSLKNIAQPVRAYRALLDKTATAGASPPPLLD